jgi:hypothetical protein
MREFERSVPAIVTSLSDITGQDRIGVVINIDW